MPKRYRLRRRSSPLPYRVANVGLAVSNRAVFLCGGIRGFRRGDVTPLTLRYDSALAVWNCVAPMQTGVTGRRDLGIASAGDHIYVVGGLDNHYRTLASVERYDVLSNQWMYVASLPTPLTKSAVFSFDGRLFVFGGSKSISDCLSFTNAAYCYDTKADVWSGNDGVRSLSCVEAFNPETQQWTKKCVFC
ncbi:kelch-like protein 22 [Paramacrobiotus metropolitanus]|uniref:kelch-like protein 22 n=1 Tax=Paramacrobiotus metropolitanus TaxID=2943436 RepID=UPI0024460CC2|nr:kelch-like protein 22 [Paramacrobiotus metropolitanus]